MKLSTKLSGLVAAIGVAGLIAGLSLSGGVAAAFYDTASAGASISVAEALDCEIEDVVGIGCPQEPDSLEVSLVLSVQPSPSTQGESVTFTATVIGSQDAGPPLGCVTFKYINVNDETAIGRVCEPGSTTAHTSVYSVNDATLPIGSFTIGVSYASADRSPYKNRSSKKFTHTVQPPADVNDADDGGLGRVETQDGEISTNNFADGVEDTGNDNTQPPVDKCDVDCPETGGETSSVNAADTDESQCTEDCPTTESDTEY